MGAERIEQMRKTLRDLREHGIDPMEEQKPAPPCGCRVGCNIRTYIADGTVCDAHDPANVARLVEALKDAIHDIETELSAADDERHPVLAAKARNVKRYRAALEAFKS